MENIKNTLRANLLALIRHEAGGELPGTQSGVTALAKRAKRLTSWAQRLLDDTDVRLSSLSDAAEAYKLQPWQLLVPDLEPAKPTALSEGPAWMLPYVHRQDYMALPPEDRVYCQAKMQAAVEERQAARSGVRKPV